MSQFTSINLSNLPRVDFAQLDRLPAVSAIYFALDAKARVLYFGQSANLAKRWKKHHRLHQLTEINRDNSVSNAWLVWTFKYLTTAEKYFITRYQPLLNNTKVTIPKIIPFKRGTTNY